MWPPPPRLYHGLPFNRFPLSNYVDSLSAVNQALIKHADDLVRRWLLRTPDPGSVASSNSQEWAGFYYELSVIAGIGQWEPVKYGSGNGISQTVTEGTW